MISQSTYTEKSDVLLSTALKLFVQNGFHGTPTSKIASEAGLSNGTLFHYFKTKDELILALYIRIKGELNEYLVGHVTGNDFLSRFKSVFTHSVLWSLKNKDELYFIQQFHFSPHLAQVSREEIAKQTRLHSELMQEGVDGGLLKPLPIELLNALVGSQIYGLHQYLVAANLAPAKQQPLIESTLKLTLHMILKG